VGGLGSGISGGAGDGVYIRIVTDIDEADQNLSKLEGSVDDVTHSFQQMEFAGQGVTTTMGNVSAGYEQVEDSAGTAGTEINAFMINATMAVSGLNQLTGSLYKTIGGLEAAGLISEENAKKLQNWARVIELATGPLEFLISMMILKQAYDAGFFAALMAQAGAFTTVGAAASTAAVAVWAFMAPILAFIIPVLAVVAVIVLLVMHWDKVTEAMKKTMLPFMMILDLHKQLWDLTVGLTSSMGSLGDAFTDNPVTKLISKAGGVFD
jgi:hypothetical protein